MTRTAGGSVALSARCQYFASPRASGTTFFVDPAQDLFAILMLQSPNQRDYYRMLFRSLVYACLLD